MPITISNHEIPLLYRALQALDGRQEVVELSEGDKTRKALQLKPYKFGGQVRMAVAEWLSAVRPISENLSKVHDALVKQYASAADPKTVDESRMPEFLHEWTRVEDDTHTFEQAPLAIADLHPEENQLPATVLSVLLLLKK